MSWFDLRACFEIAVIVVRRSPFTRLGKPCTAILLAGNMMALGKSFTTPCVAASACGQGARQNPRRESSIANR